MQFFNGTKFYASRIYIIIIIIIIIIILSSDHTPGRVTAAIATWEKIMHGKMNHHHIFVSASILASLLHRAARTLLTCMMND